MEKKIASMYDTLHSGLQGQGSKCIPGDVRGLGLESPPASAGSSPVPGLSVPPLRLGWGCRLSCQIDPHHSSCKPISCLL